MNTSRILSITALFSIMLSACEQNNSAIGSVEDGAQQSPPIIEKSAVDNTPVAQKNAFSNVFSGEMLETFDASTFTYVKIKTDNGPLWAAGPVTVFKKGDLVSFDGKTPMNDFYSKSLNRTFEIIYFVSNFSVNGVKVESSFKETSPSPSVKP